MVRPMAKSPPNLLADRAGRRRAGPPPARWPRRRGPPRRRAPGAAPARAGSCACSAVASAMSRTRCASSDRPAMSASSGSVQSISTTWTPTSSLPLLRQLAGERTMRASLGPPESASTARRNTGPPDRPRVDEPARRYVGDAPAGGVFCRSARRQRYHRPFGIDRRPPDGRASSVRHAVPPGTGPRARRHASRFAAISGACSNRPGSSRR